MDENTAKMLGMDPHEWLELQADQYARKTVPPDAKDREPSLLTRAQVRALIRDAFIEGRLTGSK